MIGPRRPSSPSDLVSFSAVTGQYVGIAAGETALPRPANRVLRVLDSRRDTCRLDSPVGKGVWVLSQGGTVGRVRSALCRVPAVRGTWQQLEEKPHAPAEVEYLEPRGRQSLSSSGAP